MERAISEMERIKRAEEIYSKRRNPEDTKNYEKKNKSIYKNLFQILLLIDIAIGIVAFQNREYIFSDEFITQVNSYNINVKEKIEEFTSTPDESNNIENTTETEENVDSKEETENQEETKTETQGAIVENESNVELSQMELDAKSILENYSVILPVSGTKTSGFGERESSNPIVTPNHKGLDIAATTGTVIVAAHSGTITQVSSEGDYGEHLRITDNNLTTLYAHCSKIYVTEGQEVTQGEAIAEVRKYSEIQQVHIYILRLYMKIDMLILN